jgi:hypothetical protein
MTNAEHFALNQWLTDYPEGISYQEIITVLSESENEWTIDNVTVWEVVENFPLDQVAEFIEDTRKAFERATQEVTA